MLGPIRQTELYVELKRRAVASDPVAEFLKGSIDASVADIRATLDHIRVYFAHFTDHSIDHSARILVNIGRLLADEQFVMPVDLSPRSRVLSSTELFLLIASALFHDIGMVISESEAGAIITSKEFLDFVAVISASNATLIHPTAPNWTVNGVGRVILADFVRRRHPERSLQIALDENRFPGLCSGHPVLRTWLGRICQAHGLPFERVSEFPTSVEIPIYGQQQTINPRFLALCLRLGDLLDIGTARACAVLRRLSEPLSALSAAHWDQYRAIAVENLGPRNNVRITGECSSPDAHRVLRDWAGWLETEFSLTSRVQSQDLPQYRLPLGLVKLEVEPTRRSDGTPAYEFLPFRFNLDERIVFERLFGRALYGRPELALREVLQNAIDAQRALVLSRLHRPDTPDNNVRNAYELALANQGKALPINVEIRRDSEGRVWLDVADHGIGMSRSVIENYLLKVGRSRWSNDQTIAELGIGHRSIGTFGIGFLSTLMIADRVVVTTKSSLPDEKGIRVTLRSWDGFATAETFDARPHGTTISLRLIDATYFSDSASFVSLVTALAPCVDFSLVLRYLDGPSITAPRISRVVEPGSDARIEPIRLSECGSTFWLGGGPKSVSASIGSWHPTLNSPLESAFQLHVCQDGISVGQMAPPLGEGPEESVLRSTGVCVDLRGPDRVALDLSRNLVEEGVSAFWGRIVPTLWHAVAVKSLDSTICRSAVAELADQLARREGRVISLGPGNNIIWSEEELSNMLGVAPLDVRSPFASVVNEYAIWFMPGLFGFLVLGTPEVMSKSMLEHALTKASGNPIDDDDIDEEFGFVDDDELGSPFVVREYSSQERRENRPDPHETEIDGDISQAKLSRDTVLRMWERLLRNHPVVSRVGEQVVLQKEKTDLQPSCEWRGLLGFRVNQSWICLVGDSCVYLFPDFAFGDFENAALAAKYDLADYYLFLHIQYVASRDASIVNVGNIGNRIRLAEIHLSQSSVQDREDEDDEEDEDGEENEGSYADVVGQQIFEEASRFRGLATRLGLEACVAPWENDRWQRRALRIANERKK